jgi:hypothetical protein
LISYTTILNTFPFLKNIILKMLKLKIKQAIKIVRRLISECTNETQKAKMENEIINLQKFSKRNK